MSNLNICEISRSELLSAYVDGMLEGEKMREVSHHITDCPHCTSEVAQLERLKSSLLNSRKFIRQPNPDFWANAYRTARVTTETTNKKVAKSFVTKQIGWGFALAACLSGTLVMLLNPISKPVPITAPQVVDQQVIDVNALVSSHASLTSFQPLADHSRLTMVESDTSAVAADGSSDDPSSTQEGAPDAGPETD